MMMMPPSTSPTPKLPLPLPLPPQPPNLSRHFDSLTNGTRNFRKIKLTENLTEERKWIATGHRAKLYV
uniref:Uncharacterized protein n=1 Tax=Octopus bimaculoides TaxID=37653 RepID=A0A0L8GTI2_OCTBM